MGAGDKSSYNKTVAEVAVFLRYGKEPTINDMVFQGKSINLSSLDDGDLSFVVIHSDNNKVWRVAAEHEYNTYVFVHGRSSQEYDILGWLPHEELIESPKRGDFYEVTNPHFFEMPESYHFEPVCARMPCDESAIWDYDTDSWDCFGVCGKHRYDGHSAQHISEYSDPVVEGEKES